MNDPIATLIVAILVFAAGLLTGRAIYRSRATRAAQRDLAGQRTSVLVALDRVVEDDPAEAYEILSKLAHEQASPPELYFALATLLRRLGKEDRAAQVYRTILARPNLPKEMTNRANIYLAKTLVAMGRAEEATQLIEALPRRLRAEAGLLHLKGTAALQQGDFETALSAGQALAKAEGSNGQARAEVLATIAQQAAARGDDEAAHKGFRKALKVRSDSVRARQGLAQLYLKEGKVGKAQRQLMAALESNPALAPILLPQLRMLLVGEDAKDDARFQSLLEDLSDQPGVSLWVELERADRMYQSHQFEACQAVLERLLEAHPRSVEAHEAYLNLLLELEDDKRLRRELERFIDLAAEEIRRFRCRRCGFLSTAPFMDCPNCHSVGELAYEG